MAGLWHPGGRTPLPYLQHLWSGRHSGRTCCHLRHRLSLPRRRLNSRRLSRIGLRDFNARFSALDASAWFDTSGWSDLGHAPTCLSSTASAPRRVEYRLGHPAWRARTRAADTPWGTSFPTHVAQFLTLGVGPAPRFLTREPAKALGVPGKLDIPLFLMRSGAGTSTAHGALWLNSSSPSMRPPLVRYQPEARKPRVHAKPTGVSTTPLGQHVRGTVPTWEARHALKRKRRLQHLHTRARGSGPADSPALGGPAVRRARPGLVRGSLGLALGLGAPGGQRAGRMSPHSGQEPPRPKEQMASVERGSHAVQPAAALPMEPQRPSETRNLDSLRTEDGWAHGRHASVLAAHQTSGHLWTTSTAWSATRQAFWRQSWPWAPSPGGPPSSRLTSTRSLGVTQRSRPQETTAGPRQKRDNGPRT